MALTTLLYGIVITSLGIIGYFATGQASKTALIPCVFGLPVIALAITAWFQPRANKQISIASLIIALLAFGGTARGFGDLVIMLTGGEVARPAATIVQSIMAIVSLIYVLISGISLIKGKRLN